MSEEARRPSDLVIEGDNSSAPKRARLTVPGLVDLVLQVPGFVSYSHFQNQDRLLGNHKPQVLATRILAPNATEISLKIELQAQGRSLSEAAFFSLRDSASVESITSVPLNLDGSFLLELREITRGEFVVSVYQGADVVAIEKISTEIFPPSLWIMTPQDRWVSSAHMLATFVRPRDPELNNLLDKAREILGTYRTSDGSQREPMTAGYQGSDEDVQAEVKAIYESTQGAGINYSNPAGSLDFENAQIIRDTKEVMAAKAATCLDSTVLFAALLESIALRPIMVITHNHAFVGYWTASGLERRLGFSSAVVDAEEAAALLRLNPPAVRFVETTKMCASPEQMDFETSMALAERTIVQSFDRSEMGERAQNSWRAIDVATVRRRGYRPMATKIENSDGSTSLIEYTIAQEAVDLNISVAEANVGVQSDTSPARVRYWKNQLLDLTFNNPLLNMKRRSASQLKLLIPKGRLGKVEDFLQQPGGELRLAPGFSPGQNHEGQFRPIRWRLAPDGSIPVELEVETEAAFVEHKGLYFEGQGNERAGSSEAYQKSCVTKVKNLARAAKQSIEETGANNLYMTFGSLRWKKKDAAGSTDPYISSPLILIPVALRPVDKSRAWAVSIDTSNDIAVNETLAMKLLEDYGIDIPALTAPEEDAAGVDIPGLVRSVRDAIVQAKQSSWLVAEDSSIGTYDFSTFHIWKDLNDNWEKLSEAPLVKHLIETDGTNVFEDPLRVEEPVSESELDSELAKVPVLADGTQLQAVVKSLRGESFIIQGPPGTGKSQTITNLLARNLQEGRKVLFMSEKPAALEVVKARLDEIKLGTFVLDLHSKNTSPAEIRNQLLAALDANPRVDSAGMESATFDFDVATKALAKYPERLHRVHPTYNESVYSVRARILSLPEAPPLSLTRAALGYFDSAKLTAFRSNLQDLPDVGEQAGSYKTNSWSFSTLTGESVTAELRAELAEALKACIQGLKKVFDSHETRAVLAKVSSIGDLENISDAPMNVPSISELRELREFQYREKLREHKQLLAEVASVIKDSPLKDNFGSIPLQKFQEELKTAVEAKLFKKKKLASLAEELQEFWAAANDQNLLEEMAKVRKLHSLGEKTADSSRGVPCIVPISLEALFQDGNIPKHLAEIERMEVLAESVGQESETIGVLLVALSADLRGNLVEFSNLFLRLLALTNADSDSFAGWLGESQLPEKLEVALNRWESDLIGNEFRDIVRWGNLLTLLKPLAEADQPKAVEEILSGHIDHAIAPRSFEHSYLNLLLEKLIDDHELGNFESSTQSANIGKLKRSSESLRIFNRDMIAGAVVKSRTFDPTAIAGKAGALRSEINKQRQQMPIRQLMKKYWDTITEITPCVAASPDSVARFLDVELAQFDLVVFDEASQLRVPNSIGALGRGKSAVIVGDSKQMPPTQLFSSASTDEDDEGFTATQPDVESILTMAEFSKLPSVMLKWHYRSQDESLIAFSNKEYYQGFLASFPSPSEKEDSERAVVWRFVEDGVYYRSNSLSPAPGTPIQTEEDLESELDFADEDVAEVSSPEGKTPRTNLRNRNPIEAARVVDEVLELYKIHGNNLNLGIVTMNEQQRDEIVSQLDARADDGLKQLMDMKATSDYLFVRALEKVQGDERDIILMSIAFSRVPDPKAPNGWTVPQNFGPLTRAGSERRLNVAVTRARQKVIVFSSFEASNLRINETSSLGMSGLRDYLLLAQYGPHQVGLGNRVGTEEPDSHRMSIARAIEALGYKTKQDVGLSSFRVDIAVENPEHPGKYALAILLDGHAWKSRPTANDRDVLPVNVLQRNMGWPQVERVWLPNWLKDQAGELARVEGAIRDAIKSQRPSTSSPAQAPDSNPAMSDLPDLESLLSQVQPSDPAPTEQSLPTSVGVNISDIEPFAELPARLVTSDKNEIQYTQDSRVKAAIVDLVRNLTAIEGPVHPNRATGYVAKCFGLSHVKSDRAAEILKAIPVNSFWRDQEGFIYPESLTSSTFQSWKRKDSGTSRDVQQISLTELGNAMVDLCERTHGLQSEELLRQTALAFGQRNLGSLIKQRLQRAMDFAISRKVLVLNGDHYEPAQSE